MNQQVLEAKQSVVKEIVEKAKKSQSITIAEFRGLSVAQIQQLRRSLQEVGAELSVYKNSLVARAVKELGYQGLDSMLVGPNALVFSKELSNGPKVLKKYSRRFGDVFTIKGGVAEGSTLGKAGIIEVADLPGREGVISMFLSCLQAPIRQFACTVQAVADAK
ncbi:MAG TPA: 50S ribosomal protein L10 [Bacilli bacterium]|nr:50S ribosomal protein L10 [Bacilli bacterium]